MATNSSASATQQALFDVLVQHGEEELQYFERLVIGFGHDRRPHVQKIDRRAMVTTLEKLATAIDEPNGICLTDVELATLSKVCAQRLAHRVIYRAGRPSPEVNGPPPLARPHDFRPTERATSRAGPLPG